jgi:hypothetical protein
VRRAYDPHGAAFPVLQVDDETLARTARQCGWSFELIESVGGHYLARARPA